MKIMCFFPIPYKIDIPNNVIQIKILYTYDDMNTEYLNEEIILLLDNGLVAKLDIKTMSIDQMQITNVVKLFTAEGFILAKLNTGEYYGIGKMDYYDEISRDAKNVYLQKFEFISGTENIYNFSESSYGDMMYVITNDGIVWERPKPSCPYRRIIYNIYDVISIKGSFALTVDGKIYNILDNEAELYADTGWTFDATFSSSNEISDGTIWHVGGFLQ